MIPHLRAAFNRDYTPERYQELLAEVAAKAGVPTLFRIAETPIFLPAGLLREMAEAGAALTQLLLDWPEYLAAARASIPPDFLVSGVSAHPNFLTADFALIRTRSQSLGQVGDGALTPRLVEMQAFPSVYAFQAMLNRAYAASYHLPPSLRTYLSGLDDARFTELLRRTICGNHAPESVVLTEVDPSGQKTLPDFLLTARALGIAVVDIASLVPVGDTLHYRNEAGSLVPIRRIYNRAIADELIARQIRLPFRLTDPWQVEWAGHPNWYFLISKFAIPWLSSAQAAERARASDYPGAMVAALATVPPAVFLDDFLAGPGLEQLMAAGVPLPGADTKLGAEASPETAYDELLLKPLFSFAGKGIQFAPGHSELEAIAPAERANYLLQQRMRFEPVIDTPHGATQPEVRILYLWPDEGELTPVLSLIRLGRGKMMGVDHNRDKEWVGASAAFSPAE